MMDNSSIFPGVALTIITNDEHVNSKTS